MPSRAESGTSRKRRASRVPEKRDGGVRLGAHTVALRLRGQLRADPLVKIFRNPCHNPIADEAEVEEEGEAEEGVAITMDPGLDRQSKRSAKSFPPLHPTFLSCPPSKARRQNSSRLSPTDQVFRSRTRSVYLRPWRKAAAGLMRWALRKSKNVRSTFSRRMWLIDPRGIRCSK